MASIFASTNRSFKLGEAARPLGALVNDRMAAIIVDSKAVAPTFPVHLEVLGVDGAPKTTWNSEVSADQFMAPSFTAMAMKTVLKKNETTPCQSTVRRMVVVFTTTSDTWAVSPTTKEK